MSNPSDMEVSNFCSAITLTPLSLYFHIVCTNFNAVSAGEAVCVCQRGASE